MANGPLGDRCEVPYETRHVLLKTSQDQRVPLDVWVTPEAQLGLHEIAWENEDGVVVGRSWGVCHLGTGMCLQEDFSSPCEACYFLRFFECRVNWTFTDQLSVEGRKAKQQYVVAWAQYRRDLRLPPDAEAR